MNYNLKKIKIVSIGSGWVVANRHIPALKNNPKFDLMTIVGRQKEKLEPIARKYSIPKIYTGDALINNKWLDECEAVMIGTDPLSHYRIAKFCLENKKHVLMEKPLTTKIQESEELAEIAKQKNLKFGIVHNFQFADATLKLDEDLKNGKLGIIKGINAIQYGNQRRRLPSWYEKLPWGLFFDESPHLLYLLNKYSKGISLNNIIKFDSTVGLNTPALVLAGFKTQIGVPATLYLNFEAPISEWYLIILGERNLGVLDIFRDIYFRLPNDGTHKSLDILRTSVFTMLGHTKGTVISGIKEVRKNHLYGNDKIIDIFAEAILNNSSLSPISINEALEINKLQFQLIRKSV